MGYKVAIATEIPHRPKDLACTWAINLDKYPGYVKTMNLLCYELAKNVHADIVICGQDDVLPDPERPAWKIGASFWAKYQTGMGVMQPIGAPWKPSGDGVHSFHATRNSTETCESPWIGRRFILEAYGGEGPYSDKYEHYFAGDELHDVASKMGVLWKREDLVQFHRHWGRTGGPAMTPYQERNYDHHYENDYAMFRARRYKDFPGSAQVGPLLIKPERKLILPEGFE